VLEGALVDQVAAHRVLQLRLPVPTDGGGNMPLVIGRGVHIHLNDAELWVVSVLSHPRGRYQYFRMRVLCHVDSLSNFPVNSILWYPLRNTCDPTRIRRAAQVSQNDSISLSLP